MLQGNERVAVLLQAILRSPRHPLLILGESDPRPLTLSIANSRRSFDNIWSAASYRSCMLGENTTRSKLSTDAKFAKIWRLIKSGGHQLYEGLADPSVLFQDGVAEIYARMNLLVSPIDLSTLYEAEPHAPKEVIIFQTPRAGSYSSDLIRKALTIASNYQPKHSGSYFLLACHHFTIPACEKRGVLTLSDRLGYEFLGVTDELQKMLQWDRVAEETEFSLRRPYSLRGPLRFGAGWLVWVWWKPTVPVLPKHMAFRLKARSV